MRKANGISLCGALALGLMQAHASAAISASATISSQQLSPSSWQYSLTLNNTGSTNIGTFWFAWIPAYDLLPSAPTAFNSPAGWSAVDTHEGIGGQQSALQWTSTTSPLTAGQSLTGFTFTSPDSPATLAGNGSLVGVPILESYVYIGAPETDPGAFFVPTTVAATPEPTSLALLIGLPALLIRRKR